MNTLPAHIHLKPDDVPFTYYLPIPVVRHLRTAIKNSTDADIEKGITALAPVGTAVEWCSPMVVACKKDGTLRHTVDLQRINAQCLRETHHCLTPFQLASLIPPDVKNTVIDVVDGYDNIPLHPDSQSLPTFISEYKWQHSKKGKNH